MLTRYLLLFLITYSVFHPLKVLAQTPNNVAPLLPGRILTPRPPQQPLPTPESLPSPSLELTVPETLPPMEQPAIPGTIVINRFEFVGNTAFTNEQLSQAIATFVNRPITFTELLQAEAAITKLYTDAGYINSGAVIPANQSFSQQGAVVTIQIIEGALEDIVVTVEGRLNPDYVQSRLALATQKPFNQKELLQALQLLQLNPLIKSISAEISAGTVPELSLLSVRVEEAETFDLELFANNGKVRSIGSFERGIGIREGNLFGIGDAISLEYANSDGSNSLYGTYTLPVNPQNGTLRFSGQWNSTWVIEEPFNQLDITGDSLYLDLTYRQPIIQTPTQELALGLTGSYSASQTSLLGVDFPLSPGADEQGQTKISALRFFQEWTQRGSEDVLALRSQFSVGLGLLDATFNAQPPDGRFFEWQGQGQYVRLLAPDTLFVFRTALQLSTDPLVPLEQLTLGGLNSVRGYRQDFFLTDNGIFASAEVRFPLLRVNEVNGLLQIVPFVDYGTGWNDDANPLPTPNPNTLVSVGLGLIWQMGDRFNARLDWGLPLTEFKVQGNTLSQQSLYFSINYQLF
ncbi:MAG: ShlB/FhaC/HecB family hemolysin secretion/activation protein [Snowella sp.]|nr:ShlB/FhaC/HecB family hemolysin secretion/activation protein [Snowella sp.]